MWIAKSRDINRLLYFTLLIMCVWKLELRGPAHWTGSQDEVNHVCSWFVPVSQCIECSCSAVFTWENDIFIISSTLGALANWVEGRVHPYRLVTALSLVALATVVETSMTNLGCWAPAITFWGRFDPPHWAWSCSAAMPPTLKWQSQNFAHLQTQLGAQNLIIFFRGQ